MTDLNRRLEAILRATPQLMTVMRTARGLDLPDWLIFSGAIYQPVWNHLTGRPADYGIKDYDLGYFDPSDLSYEAEDVIIRQVAAAFDEPLSSMVEVRNQARVHLWFEHRFREPYVPLPNSSEALTRFVAPAFSVGARLEDDDSLTIVAPFGLEDLFSMTLRPNPHRQKATGWDKVVASARARWPELTVVEEED
ncbi:nucleotidyltransferase family protein [Caulobacter sp. NIBR2454]|uniref:nucleotidyltransferase family protein n=1 Tax=Caulobacter sp. NIBR2454 TaxID=3015996 RepID=UPI0022B60930|nr:nucleotidyltransferase family protein [Caulobacter sp. NIBR2454]